MQTQEHTHTLTHTTWSGIILLDCFYLCLNIALSELLTPFVSAMTTLLINELALLTEVMTSPFCCEDWLLASDLDMQYGVGHLAFFLFLCQTIFFVLVETSCKCWVKITVPLPKCSNNYMYSIELNAKFTYWSNASFSKLSIMVNTVWCIKHKFTAYTS